MDILHTLLFYVREEHRLNDLALAGRCLKSLENSVSTAVVVYNQGCLTSDELAEFLKSFALECTIIGDGTNAGIVAGRQAAFTYILREYPYVRFISELHTDMIFKSRWEAALMSYLEANDEPVISCGITSDGGVLARFPDGVDAFLASFQSDRIERGFNHPCLHKMEVLRAVGGYDTRFLTGKHAFEDDSLLIGYHYYYGTRAAWHPKINCNSFVYHAVGAQRYGLSGDLFENFDGLVRQYGALGVGVLAELHVSPWQKDFFTAKFAELTGGDVNN